MDASRKDLAVKIGIAAVIVAVLAVGYSLTTNRTGSETQDADAGAAGNAAVGGIGLGPTDATTPTPGQNSAAPGEQAAPRSATYSLKAIGDWKQSGSVTLTDLVGNQTRIDVTLGGAKVTSAQPAAIYAGTCGTQQAAVQYALNPVVNGKSSTTLDVNIGAIVGSTAQALKVKRDPTDANLPLAACADLK